MDPGAYEAANPNIAFFDSTTHGYDIVEVTPERLTYRVQPVKNP